MLDYRSFVSGIGAGLILGASLFALMNLSAGPDTEVSGPVSVSGTLTLDQLRQEAQRRGYDLMTRDELDAVITDKLAAERKKWETEQRAATDRQESGNGSVPATKIAVYLSGGLNAEEIAHALYLSGVIADREQFIRTVKEQKLGGKIRAGYYEFDGIQEVSAVIEKLTSSRKS